MPTAIWTGSLSLGMVVVPVRLYPAIKKRAVRFHELDRAGRRVRHIRVSEPDAEWEPPAAAARPPRPQIRLRPEVVQMRGFDPPDQRSPGFEPEPSEVAYEEVRKGYEVAPGEYISMTREEVTALAPERSRVIDVQQFVDVSAVDPIYFESRYYVVPDREWSTPFRLLRQAMAAADRMAIAWLTLRSRRYLSVVRPFDEVMLLTTMVHADEIVGAEYWIGGEDSTPTEKELKMARLLIDTLSGPFEPERYPDEHRRRVLEAIEERVPIAVSQTPPSPTKVLDLMAALEASVKAARAARNEDQARAKPKAKRRIGSQ